MKKNIKASLLPFLLMALWVAFAQNFLVAQQTNGHVGVIVGATSGLGFEGPSIGAGGGFDARKDKFVFSGDVDVFTINKVDGGKGWQVRGRETARYHFKDFFIQGGAVQSYYSNVKYTKSSFEPLVGIGVERGNKLFQVNYRHDLTSENKVRTVEGIATVYARKHFYFRGAVTISHFRFAGGSKSGSGVGASATVGAYF